MTTASSSGSSNTPHQHKASEERAKMNRWLPLLRRKNYDSNLVSSVFSMSVRYMSKYLSKQATKRLPLTTKRARKGYYKGKGGTKEGRLTSKGKFIVDPLKRLQLIVPELEGFKLKPYVAISVPREEPENRPEQMPSSH